MINTRDSTSKSLKKGAKQLKSAKNQNKFIIKKEPSIDYSDPDNLCLDYTHPHENFFQEGITMCDHRDFNDYI